ncbi:uncharacterized protein LOC144864046 [Branchiostoma floridae x Branchiostoma japonicum]
MGAVNTKAFSAGKSVVYRTGQHRSVHVVSSGVRTTNQIWAALLYPKSAEYHNIKVSSAPKVPIGMLWNVEGNGLQDTLHMTGDKHIATTPLLVYEFYDRTVPEMWKDGGGLVDTMGLPDLKWLHAFSNYKQCR